MNIAEFVNSWLAGRGVTEFPALDAWLATMREQRFARGEALVNAGQRSNRVFILRDGLVRLFYTTADGRERNKAFYGPGEVTGAISAAMTGSPAPFGVEALEPTLAVAADFDTLLDLSRSDPTANYLYLELLSRAFIRNEQREAMLLTCNAEQRYLWLLEEEPELLSRVPQFHIASYLGVDPVSLSRLKRKLGSNSAARGEGGH